MSSSNLIDESFVIEEFNLCSNISEEVITEIKILHVFDDEKGYNVLFITSDDKVFGFGSNCFGCCGLGHNSVVNEPQIIPELCHKNIQQFFIGYDFILALNKDNKVYGWGMNDLGQCGRGTINCENEYLPPKLIDFNRENVIQICCRGHSMALTPLGHLYGWGRNKYGQVGCGKERGEIILKPYLLRYFNELSVKSIYSSFLSSYALTCNGMVYSWGRNGFCELGHQLDIDECIFEPRLIHISDIISVCPSTNNTYFLTNEGHIYFSGVYFSENVLSYQKIPKLIKSEMKFSSLHSIPIYQERKIISSAISENNIYYIIRNKIYKEQYEQLFSFYLGDYRISYKTIKMSKEFDGNDLSDLHSHKNILQINNRFEDRFINVKELGSGGYGTVFKVYHNWSSKSFAIKKIVFKTEDMMREVNTLSQLSGEYVVQYFDHWIENNNCLYIQMELCSDNLQNIIRQKPRIFKREKTEPMKAIEYFISCELFKELLECVQYLHESNPPVIHRDLKPQNILVYEYPKNNRFLKVGDFGCAKFISLITATQTQCEGTLFYMAPEVKKGKKYNTKADIYSLGMIAQEVFEFDINE